MDAPTPKQEAEQWDDPYPKKQRSFSWLWSLLLVLAFYVLSSGPANALFVSGNLSPAAKRALTVLYMPLAKLHNAHPAVAGVLQWYLSLWK